MSQLLNDPAKRAQIAQILSEYEDRQRSDGREQGGLGLNGISADLRSGEPGDGQDAMMRLSLMLPEAHALSSIPQLRARLDLEIMEIKEEIADLQYELKDEQDPESMEIIQSHIAELISQIHHIRHSSTEAESIVKSITTDIQRLDTAKRNLVESLKAVKRWGMLTQAYGELVDLLEVEGPKDYRRISNSMAAITALLEPMRPLVANPPVAQLIKDVQDVQTTVKESVGTNYDKP